MPFRIAGILVAAASLAGCQTIAPAPVVPLRAAVPVVLDPPPLQPQRPLDGYVSGVDNFGFVTAGVWRGAKPTADGLRTLAAMGVRTVIDLQEADESADVPPGVRYVPIRVSEWRADAVDTAAVVRAVADNPKPVFIHCREGRDRTGLAVAAYRLSQGMTPADATREMDQFHVHFWWRGSMEKRIRRLARALPAAAAARVAE